MSHVAVRTSRLADGTAMVRLSGIVEGQALDTLRRELVALLMHERPARVLIDGMATTAVDATALGTLEAAAETAEDLGIPLTIRGFDGRPDAAAA
ncbi:MAG: STAS domain-containing protein [Micromonosporaceae bacterium]|nr:STAS domain-containing protein [Micromonosporaceae bacterium]